MARRKSSAAGRSKLPMVLPRNRTSRASHPWRREAPASDQAALDCMPHPDLVIAPQVGPELAVESGQPAQGKRILVVSSSQPDGILEFQSKGFHRFFRPVEHGL